MAENKQQPGGSPPSGQDTALAEKGTLGNLSDLLLKHKDQIAVALPRHMTPERMIRVALTAVNRSELLQKCDIRTIAGCVVQSSQLGLECDGALGEAYLVPFWNWKANKKKGGYECQLMVGYQGLIKLVRNTNQLVMIDAQEVCVSDEFDYEYGLDPFLRHKHGTDQEGNRGDITHYWAAAVLAGGGRQFAVMTKKEIEEHRDKYSKGAYETEGWGKDKTFKVDSKGQKILQGPWRDSPDWMFKKTVLRKLCKLLPKSAQAQLAVQLDEARDAGLPQRFSTDVPFDLNQTGVDEDEDDVAQAMKKQTDASAADLENKLNQQGNGQGEESGGKKTKKASGKKADPSTENKAEPAAGGQDAGQQPATAESSSPAAEEEGQGAEDDGEEELPDEYPQFKGNAQAQNVKEMPSAEDISNAFTIAKQAGVKPSREAIRLYGINPDELSKEAMAHFLGYLKWLIAKKGDEVAAAAG